jgi:hypothetical protein
MRLTIIGALIFLTMGLNGCLSTHEPVTPPFTPDQIRQLRDEYRQYDHQARVGIVTAVLPNSNLASVGSVPVKDFDIGDIITFIDSNRKVLTLGTVEAIGRNTLTVRYKTPGKNGRAPVEGDAAVRAIH